MHYPLTDTHYAIRTEVRDALGTTWMRLGRIHRLRPANWEQVEMLATIFLKMDHGEQPTETERLLHEVLAEKERSPCWSCDTRDCDDPGCERDVRAEEARNNPSCEYCTVSGTGLRLLGRLR